MIVCLVPFVRSRNSHFGKSTNGPPPFTPPLIPFHFLRGYVIYIPNSPTTDTNNG